MNVTMKQSSFVRILLCLNVFCVSASAFAETVYVPDTYSTIQDAINAVSNGDTVVVSPGT